MKAIVNRYRTCKAAFMKHNRRTYIRTFNSTAISKIFIFDFLKKIVNFYYNTGTDTHNIFKNSVNMPINYTEQKNNSDFFKITGN